VVLFLCRGSQQSHGPFRSRPQTGQPIQGAPGTPQSRWQRLAWVAATAIRDKRPSACLILLAFAHLTFYPGRPEPPSPGGFLLPDRSMLALLWQPSGRWRSEPSSNPSRHQRRGLHKPLHPRAVRVYPQISRRARAHRTYPIWPITIQTIPNRQHPTFGRYRCGLEWPALHISKMGERMILTTLATASSQHPAEPSKGATLYAIAKADTVARSSQTAPRRPALSIIWALDPTTGKPMARWIIEGSEEIRSLAA
jgi:hypothetical protein